MCFPIVKETEITQILSTREQETQGLSKYSPFYMTGNKISLCTGAETNDYVNEILFLIPEKI